jgi:RimJ/RimL family protein N-acetyltransferase
MWYGPVGRKRGASSPEPADRVGPRVRLRPIRSEDADRVLELARDDEVRRFFIWEPPRDLQEARGYTEAFAYENAHGFAYHYAIMPRGARLMAGVADLYHLRWHARQAEIGIWLGRDYWGQGLAAAANELLLEQAFGELVLERVVYSIATENLRSQRAFEKMGARREGSVLLYSSRLGRDVEHFVYRILRAEWFFARCDAVQTEP